VLISVIRIAPRSGRGAVAGCAIVGSSQAARQARGRCAGRPRASGRGPHKRGSWTAQGQAAILDALNEAVSRLHAYEEAGDGGDEEVA